MPRGSSPSWTNKIHCQACPHRGDHLKARYPALPLDLANAVNVVLAEEYETDAVLTLDRRGFRTVLPLTEHKAFRVLPDDLWARHSGRRR